ncbi:hypothetical protein LOK49_LG06G00087 [Camellia lanceoleosa]|uniref:Uncharacterized protein n=1 Tax=Camellia lanceoleosa TaxID=1840588 RepID=A0ACC0HCW1_9ERIC|nr:hypothetical protein LOK49_LG06G00087 [Camellia lanceoleosa]
MSAGTPDNHHDDSGEEACVFDLSGADDSNVAAEDNVPQPNTTDAAINGHNYSSSSSSVAKGFSSVLSSVITDFDSRAEDTVRSQDQLSFAIDRLTRELDQLLEDAVPFIMQHAVKISGVRKRVTSLNTLLKSIQRRLDNVDRMLSVGLLHEKADTESARQH